MKVRAWLAALLALSGLLHPPALHADRIQFGEPVDIFDDGFNKVASSPPIKGTEWQPHAVLSRGALYRWQVTAVVNGEEVKSPVRPAPDAKFKVLDANAANRLADARAKHSRSHLLLGVLYAEAGLLADAERELGALVKKNPDSAVARRLLEKVRSAR